MRETEPSPAPFKTWRSWYLLVILSLMLLIILFYLFSSAFK